ncbi:MULTISPECIES: Glu-tRNA(Gln) amidotransferase subunit GatE [unclassified Archaeoglobus]|jgi:glutamyl-tRNA(Gln) amidotransferase subunit E|uniref:Glu-tRNA(Gln) amidotransferase subunit GatE n=1 Tax=unclassified Archaeoglobus TaxID=2643606 RepID=UPI0025B80147|nr:MULTISPECIES: Glu-tRNA(Gln) amidotransferase subunit GatE [unclassified Archaeoglobus]
MVDYGMVGLKVGIEIHQQLDTKHKLFCYCPTTHREVEESNFEFFRYLRLKKSEIGEEDRAAKEEVERSRRFIYKYYDTTCLVEADEEPPRELNKEALQIAIQVAKMLNMEVADEVHVMRKIVIDGSNTTGFQRTALVALDGFLEVEGKRVRVATLCLEEEACRKVREGEGFAVYSLDRLGIPLVEIGTEPDIDSPEMAKKVAAKLGMILRSTGKVKRGLGTIRQDVNISIKDGARVEIKGVQELDILDKIVEYEVIRQLRLLEIREELKKRGAEVTDEIFDVTEVFRNTKSKIIRNKTVNAILLKGFAGLVGKEIQPGRRLGTEFADIAKSFGLGGIFHTDELPAYGISGEEVERLREFVGAGGEDAVVMAAGDAVRVERALKRIIERAKFCLVGVPEETRKANEDGTTSYLRPLPGAARMYPETDVPPVVITEEMLKVEIPELIEERAKRYEELLPRDLAWEMANSPHFRLFEEYVEKLQPTVVARVLHTAPAYLRKDGVDIGRLREKHFRMVLDLIADGKMAKEGAEEALKILAENPSASGEEVLKKLGSAEDVDEFIRKLVEERADFVRERGEGAFKPLMGLVMKEFRGKVDGKVVAEKLRKAIEEKISGIS